MENKVIYVPVSVQEELPDKEGTYVVQEAGYPPFQRTRYFAKMKRRFMGEQNITHFLKRIELPSEEEIFKAEGEFYKNGMKVKPSVYTFRSGINYILSIINQKK